jgi:hypothetical protein
MCKFENYFIEVVLLYLYDGDNDTIKTVICWCLYADAHSMAESVWSSIHPGIDSTNEWCGVSYSW